MSAKIKLKEVYEVQNQYKAFYTGGTVQWSPNGQELLCQNSGAINLISVSDESSEPVIFGANPSTTSAGDNDDGIAEDSVYTFALANSGEHVVSAHRSGLLRIAGDQLVASGGTDTTVRIWDPMQQVCVGTLRGCVGVVSLLVFHPDEERKVILAAGDDAKIYAWNYETRELVKTFAGHFSKVTAVSFSNDRKFLVSAGRDKILVLWDYDTQQSVKTIPVYESLESVIVLPDGIRVNGQKLKKGKIYAACAGEEGLIKVWEMTETAIVYKQSNSLVTKSAEEGGLAITEMLLNRQTSQLAVVSADHNIIIHDLETFECFKQLSGFSDEILDLILFGKKDRFLGMATNSNDFKVYDTTTMNCQLVKGHTDIVLSLSANDKFMLSSSKDNSIRLWQYNAAKFEINCVAIGLKHTNAVGSVSLSKISGKFCASVSQDRCLKVWKIPKEFNQTSDEKELTRLNCTLTELAHEKDINCVSISRMTVCWQPVRKTKPPSCGTLATLSLVGVFEVISEEFGRARAPRNHQKLSNDHKETLLKHAIEWNTNSRNCRPAQLVLNILLQEILAGAFQVSELNKHLTAALPYTERHFARMTEYAKDLKFIEYTLQCMQPHAARATNKS
ncbi:hypothetical protein quinque_005543 [Culex quinquefasciatus]